MKLKLLLAGALLVSACPAVADWQYTKWGMTPSKVVAASKGKAKLGEGESQDRVDREKIGAIGTYASGDRKFAAIFYFRQGKLNQVNLKLQGDDTEARCGSILTEFKSNYGDADPSSIEGVTSWKDYRGKNIVRLIAIGEMCNIHYEESGAHNLSL